MYPVYFQGEGSQVLLDSVGQGYFVYGSEVPGIPGSVDRTHIYQAQKTAFGTVFDNSSVASLVGFGTALSLVSLRKRWPSLKK